MKHTYYSNALWPYDSGVQNIYGEPKSKDVHESERASITACKALEREGLGGQGKIFPVRTWVSNKCDNEDAGWCNFQGCCKYKLICDDGSAACECCL